MRAIPTLPSQEYLFQQVDSLNITVGVFPVIDQSTIETLVWCTCLQSSMYTTPGSQW